MPTHETFVGRTLRHLRKRQGFSQFQLAARAGLSLNTVSIAERSGHFSERTAERLAAALGVPVESLRPANHGGQP